ncbi:hypothetical protein FBD94_21190 [Pedobacter hiemivivus]|uniref:Uncharacterized protein n=1 Tax=Pedobacter hiemivivus TaxID=2530454 RepID=A0A4U1G2X1_9SPHI|nr:hypothetical protein [Pedobacter hiemivivus]TCC96528.1 hypothetical protein EZ444_11145 [Pedobacter hiemivivus]TKC57149.1 hypothetical protein FBD94_21190 [Pedobacter hiemivivus]
MHKRLFITALYTILFFSCNKKTSIDSVYDQIVDMIKPSFSKRDHIKIEIVGGHRTMFGKVVAAITKSQDQCQVQYFSTHNDIILAPGQDILNADYPIQLDTTYQVSAKQLIEKLIEEKKRDLTRPITFQMQYHIRVIKNFDTVNFTSKDATGLGTLFRKDMLKN